MADKSKTKMPESSVGGPPETPNLTCRAGPDPTNKATANAAVTIYNGNMSVYHLDKANAQPMGLEGALKSFGIDLKTSREAGAFSHSRALNHPWHDPLHLATNVDQIQVEFSSGKLKDCTIGEGLVIPAVDALQKPSTPGSKVSAAPSFEPSSMG